MIQGLLLRPNPWHTVRVKNCPPPLTWRVRGDDQRRGKSSKQLPFEKARRRGPRHAQHLEFWTRGNKLVLRVDQGSEVPQKMKLKRPHQQPAVGDKVHEAGKVDEKFLPKEGGGQRTLGKILNHLLKSQNSVLWRPSQQPWEVEMSPKIKRKSLWSEGRLFPID